MKVFVRDVLVNVLANLIAAAVLYLLGVLVGLFPRIDEAVTLAVLLILSMSLLVLVVAAISRIKLQSHGSAYRKSLYITAGAGIVCGCGAIAMYQLLPDGSVFDRVTGTIGGVAFTLLMVAVFVALRVEKNISSAKKGARERGDADRLGQ